MGPLSETAPAHQVHHRREKGTMYILVHFKKTSNCTIQLFLASWQFDVDHLQGRKHAKLHFGCQGRSNEEHCLYKSTFYALKTRCPRTWIHLMFLALQARSPSAISTRESSVSALKNCWEILKCDNISFVTLVTGAFPPAKVCSIYYS